MAQNPKSAGKTGKPSTGGKKSKAKSDNTPIYIAIGSVVLVAGAMAAYFFTHTQQEKTKKVDKQDYVQLPQVIIESNEQVARLQVTVQVSEKDHDWLEANKRTIGEIVQIASKEIEPSKFRSAEGRVAVLDYLKDAINSKMKVDKVRGVLYADMLVEDRVDEQ
jgi:flagellar basal body-associated protein FliL